MTLKQINQILAIDREFAPAFLSGDAAAFDRRGDNPPVAPAAVSVISLTGGLRNRSYFGGGMQDLRSQIREAAANPKIKSIILDIDSPGGTVAGTPETAQTVRDAAAQKPVIAAVNTFAASAAYWIAAQASEIYVTPSGQVGSIGVFSAHTDFSAMDEMMGVKTTLISAGKFKVEGNPYEPLSAEARAQYQHEVDQAYDDFVGAVALGRDVSAATVKAKFGQGRMVKATDAVAVGMVDGIAPIEQIIANQTSGASARRSQFASVSFW